ncbi:MAG: hypothetical protein U9R77_02230 [Pseudomonadota bacterium]|uniref:hypothetical protein n=1 Tax=Sphingobium naphthae TaxID=1886786 RepID=UPI002B09114C|nr:hypothetical protein [Pseudomonadota bacterium]
MMGQKAPVRVTRMAVYFGQPLLAGLLTANHSHSCENCPYLMALAGRTMRRPFQAGETEQVDAA